MKSVILTGIVTFVCPPMGAIYSLIGIRNKDNQWMWHIFFLSLVMAVFAYNYQPAGGTDLVRYFEYLEQYRNYSFDDLLYKMHSGWDTQYVYHFVMWVVAKIGNPHLLPALSVFGTYYCAFYITEKIAEGLEIDRATVTKYFVYILMASSFFLIVNIVRNVIAFMLISVAVFREVYLKKKDWVTLLLYIVPLFIHTSAILFLLLRFCISIIGKIRYVSLGLVLIIEPILFIWRQGFGYVTTKNIIARLLVNMLNKAADYYFRTDTPWAIKAARSGSVQVTKILYVCQLIFFIWMLIWIYRRKIYDIYSVRQNDLNVRLKKWMDFVYLILLATVAMLPMKMPEYSRVGICVFLTGSIVFFVCCDNRKKFSPGKHINLVFLIASLSLIVWLRDIIVNSDWVYLLYHSTCPLLACVLE